jgi:hypothetical protein
VSDYGVEDIEDTNTVEWMVSYYKNFGWTDLGLISGTRTMRKGPVSPSALFVSIWMQPGDNSRVVAEEY